MRIANGEKRLAGHLIFEGSVLQLELERVDRQAEYFGVKHNADIGHFGDELLFDVGVENAVSVSNDSEEDENDNQYRNGCTGYKSVSTRENATASALLGRFVLFG